MSSGVAPLALGHFAGGDLIVGKIASPAEQENLYREHRKAGQLKGSPQARQLAIPIPRGSNVVPWWLTCFRLLWGFEYTTQRNLTCKPLRKHCIFEPCVQNNSCTRGFIRSSHKLVVRLSPSPNNLGCPHCISMKEGFIPIAFK